MKADEIKKLIDTEDNFGEWLWNHYQEEYVKYCMGQHEAITDKMIKEYKRQQT